MNTKSTTIIKNCGNVCYYKINPYNLANMEYTSQEYLEIFERTYMITNPQIINKAFDRTSVIFNNLAIEYQAGIIEKELNELSAIFEDKKHIINLAAIYDKQGMNSDILAIIYKNLVSANAYDKYKGIISELGNYWRLESVARILEA
jgi:hypothetical protein